MKIKVKKFLNTSKVFSKTSDYINNKKRDATFYWKMLHESKEAKPKKFGSQQGGLHVKTYS